MIIQPLLRPGSEPSSDGRASADGESPNEMFARALAESVQAARGAGPDTVRRSGADGRGWAGLERAENRIDPRSETAVIRSGGNIRRKPVRPSVDRPGHADHDRADHRRADGHRAEDRGHDRTDRVKLARPDDLDAERPGAERPGAQEVDPAGDPVRPETPGSGKGKRVAFADAADVADPSAELEVQDSPLASVLASLMGVDADDADAFLQTLMAGLTRSQGVESAEELMARLATLADRLGGGDTLTGAGVADTELVAAVIDASVDAGLVEPMAPDADPTALLVALTSAIAGGGTRGAGPTDGAAIDEPSATVDGVAAGSGLDLADLESADGTGEPAVGQARSLGSDDSPAIVDETENDAPSVGADDSATGTVTSDGAGDVTIGDGTTDGTAGGPDSAAIEDGAGNGTDHATADGTTDGTDNAATDRIAPDAAMARPGDTSAGAASSAAESGIGGPAGVTATGRAAAPARSATATPNSTEGLVELANNRLAEQLRPAFAAVRRGIDGLEELRLRLRNEGGAPIRVDISTVDGEVRVVLSGTNDDVMQRLGQERERLADELRRAGFTSTTIDVRSEGGDPDNRRPGTPTTPDRGRGGSYASTGGTEGDTSAVAGADRSATTGLDLDL